MSDQHDVLSRPYRRVLVFDSDSGSYTASIQEFPGCFAEGESLAEAMADLERAMVAWAEAAADLGQTIPSPLEEVEHSGRVLVRMPKSLHRRAAELAHAEGVSLNQLIVTAVAEAMGAKKGTEAPQPMLTIVIGQRQEPKSWAGLRGGQGRMVATINDIVQVTNDSDGVPTTRELQ